MFPILPRRRLGAATLTVAVLTGTALIAATPSDAVDTSRVPTTAVYPIVGSAKSCSKSWGLPWGDHRHQGDDCWGATNTPILAVEAGRIVTSNTDWTGTCADVRAGRARRSGNYVGLLGDSGTYYYYGHFNTVNVSSGRVTAGQQLGTLGNTGNARCSAPHLHFEIHPEGRHTSSVNPDRWLFSAGWVLRKSAGDPPPAPPGLDDGGDANETPLAGVTGDWNGDGSDTVVSVSRTAAGLEWRIRNANSAGAPTATFVFGARDAYPVTGDWDGNGTTTIGAVEITTGGLVWKLRNSNTAGAPDFPAFTYGSATAVPVTGDWNGDRRTTIGVVDTTATAMVWKLRNTNSSGAIDYPAFSYGPVGAVPVTGDWDGNGTTTIGVVGNTDANGHLWLLKNSISAGYWDIGFHYGPNDSIPVTGDWNDDGRATIGVVLTDNEALGLNWLLRNSNDAGFWDVPNFYYGATNMIP